MNKKLPIYLAKKFLQDLDYSITIKTLTIYAEKLGFSVQYYGDDQATKGNNILDLIHRADYAETQQSFYYVDQNCKLIFIRSHLQENTTLSLLIHEIGHVLLGHPCENHQYKEAAINQEIQANIFTSYVINSLDKNAYLLRHQKQIKKAAMGLICILIVTLSISYYYINYYPRFFVTMEGNRYHTSACNYIEEKPTAQISKQEATEARLTPCKICINN